MNTVAVHDQPHQIGDRPCASPAIALGDAPAHVALVLQRAEGPADFCRRLSTLGLRRGAQVRVVHRTVGKGRVVEVAGAHIALDREVLTRLFVEGVR